MRARLGPTQATAPVVVALMFALGLGFASAAPASAAARSTRAASAPTVTRVTLLNRQVFTPTTVVLHRGDEVSITATGTIHFGGGRITAMTPPGIPWGTECQSIALSEPRKNPWPAPGLSCWSLIATVDNGRPIEIGRGSTFRASRAGKLTLGLNDNFVDDNTGEWIATIGVTAAPPVTTPGSVPQPTSKKSSSTAIFVLIGAVVLVAVLSLVLYLRVGARRRRRNAEWRAIEESALPEPAMAAGAAAGLASLAAEPPPPPPDPVISAPPETDSIDVNIFEVEFSNGLTLRVGYNHFPEGTELRWRVTQSRNPVADGVFVARGGGSTSHVETVPLGVKLAGRDTHPDGADVQFDWSINGVPFRYSVRRDPNC